MSATDADARLERSEPLGHQICGEPKLPAEGGRGQILTGQSSTQVPALSLPPCWEAAGVCVHTTKIPEAPETTDSRMGVLQHPKQ